jgi:hypothetical protein
LKVSVPEERYAGTACDSARQASGILGPSDSLRLCALKRRVLYLRTLALPEAVKQWSLTSLREKLIKIGAKVVRHGRYVIFQMAEVAVPRELFQEILRLIDGLRPRPAPA